MPSPFVLLPDSSERWNELYGIVDAKLMPASRRQFLRGQIMDLKRAFSVRVNDLLNGAGKADEDRVDRLLNCYELIPEVRARAREIMMDSLSNAA